MSFNAEEADSGLITFVPDELDWEDEIRVQLRTDLPVPGRFDGMEHHCVSLDRKHDTKSSAGGLPGKTGSSASECVGPEGALKLRQPTQAHFDFKGPKLRGA